MTTIRERAQAYLELASKASDGPWRVDDASYQGWNGWVSELTILPECAVRIDGDNPDDAQFIAASRTEGVWAAQKLLEAVGVMYVVQSLLDRDVKESALKYNVASALETIRQFLEGGKSE